MTAKHDHEDSILFLKKLIQLEVIDSSRALVEYLDAINASQEMRDAVLAARLFNFFSERFHDALASSTMLIRSAIQIGIVRTHADIDFMIRREAQRLHRDRSYEQACVDLRIEARQNGLYKLLEIYA